MTVTHTALGSSSYELREVAVDGAIPPYSVRKQHATYAFAQFTVLYISPALFSLGQSRECVMLAPRFQVVQHRYLRLLSDQYGVLLVCVALAPSATERPAYPSHVLASGWKPLSWKAITRTNLL